MVLNKLCSPHKYKRVGFFNGVDETNNVTMALENSLKDDNIRIEYYRGHLQSVQMAIKHLAD